MIDELIKRIEDVEIAIEKLGQEKEKLRRQLEEKMMQEGLKAHSFESKTHDIKVRLQNRTTIDYDIPLLQKRLGGKYKQILRPDYQLFRKNAPELKALLGDDFELAGVPDRKLVKKAIDDNLIDKSDFEGAYTKETKEYLMMRFIDKA